MQRNGAAPLFPYLIVPGLTNWHDNGYRLSAGRDRGIHIADRHSRANGGRKCAANRKYIQYTVSGNGGPFTDEQCRFLEDTGRECRDDDAFYIATRGYLNGNAGHVSQIRIGNGNGKWHSDRGHNGGGRNGGAASQSTRTT